MKKAVITILLALPFVLMILISVAGMIITEYRPIPVQSVYFTDEDGGAFNGEMVLGKNASVQLKWGFFPSKANDKDVTFASSDNSVVSVTKDGQVSALKYGSAKITVTVVSNKVQASLDVVVADKAVTGVSFTVDALTLKVGQEADLVAVVEPYTAENKRVTYTVADPSVAQIDGNGHIKANAEGSTTVYAITADGGFVASAVLTVEGSSPLRFKPYEQGKVAFVLWQSASDETDLFEYLITDFSYDELTFEIIEGAGNASIVDGKLTVNVGALVTVKVSAGEYNATATFVNNGKTE